MADIVIVRPSFDAATAFLYQWTADFADNYTVNYPMDTVKVFNKADAISDKVYKYIETLDSNNQKVLFHFDHGSYDTLFGQDKDIFLNAAMTDKLAGFIVYAFACESARILGPQAIDAGVKAYMGYKEIFGFILTKGKEFKNISVIPAQFIAQGNSMGDVYTKTAGMLENYMNDFYTEYEQTGTYDSYMSAIWMYKDLRGLTLLGDPEAKINRGKVAKQDKFIKKAYTMPSNIGAQCGDYIALNYLVYYGMEDSEGQLNLFPTNNFPTQDGIDQLSKSIKTTFIQYMYDLITAYLSKHYGVDKKLTALHDYLGSFGADGIEIFVQHMPEIIKKAKQDAPLLVQTLYMFDKLIKQPFSLQLMKEALLLPTFVGEGYVGGDIGVNIAKAVDDITKITPTWLSPAVRDALQEVIPSMKGIYNKYAQVKCGATMVSYNSPSLSDIGKILADFYALNELVVRAKLSNSDNLSDLQAAWNKVSQQAFLSIRRYLAYIIVRRANFPVMFDDWYNAEQIAMYKEIFSKQERTILEAQTSAIASAYKSGFPSDTDEYTNILDSIVGKVLEWFSSNGHKRDILWVPITKAYEMLGTTYTSLSYAMIDYIIDLEHNKGNVFDKIGSAYGNIRTIIELKAEVIGGNVPLSELIPYVSRSIVAVIQDDIQQQRVKKPKDVIAPSSDHELSEYNDDSDEQWYDSAWYGKPTGQGIKDAQKLLLYKA